MFLPTLRGRNGPFGAVKASHMKLHQLLQKCSFFLIKLAAFQASGAACMKLHESRGHFHEVPHTVSEYRRQTTEIG